MQYITKNLLRLLANRVRVILPKIVSPFQNAFIPNKGIHDNSLVAHEILSSFFQKKGYMANKLDMKKAYKRLDWEFIKKCFSVTWNILADGLIGLCNVYLLLVLRFL